MKSIIFAIVCLATTAAVSAADNCLIECHQSNKPWDGNSSLVIEIGTGAQIIFEKDDKVFAVTNTQLGFVIAARGHFILILNIRTGGYLLIDNRTQYAVYGKIVINFLTSNGTIDNDKEAAQLKLIFSAYTEINAQTVGAFNFNLLIVSFFQLQFDLTIIYSGQSQLIANLQASFGVLFKLMQRAIVQGSISVSTNVWGFAILIMGVEYEIAASIVEVVRLCIQYYGELNIEIMVELTRRIQLGVVYLRQFAVQFVAFLSVQVNVSVKVLIAWINNVSNKPVKAHVTIGDTTYTLVVIKINERYVINWSFSSSSGGNTDIQIIFADDVLFINNFSTNIAIALYRRYLLVCNVTAQHALLLTWNVLGSLKVAVVDVRQLVFDLRAQMYSRIAADVKAIIRSAKSISISWIALARAIASGSQAAVSQYLGSTNGAIAIRFYYRFCVTATGSSSVGAIVTSSFGTSRVVSTMLSTAINGAAVTSQNWGIFIKTITGGHFSVKSG